MLFDLFVTAELDAKEALSLLTLKRGENRFVFEDAPASSHKAVIFWEGKGVRLLMGSFPKVAYPRRAPKVVMGRDEVCVLFPERVGVWLDADEGIVKGIKRLMVGQREVLAPPSGNVKAPIASVITGGKIEPVKDWAAYLRERLEKCGKSGDFPSRGNLEIDHVPIQEKCTGWRKEGDWVCITVKLTKGLAEWLFAPAKETIGGGVYRGLKWKLRLKGVGRVYEVAVEEPVLSQ